MENPTLRLVVEKGPKEGETLECKPGAHARIGRVVKGNTFAIRDPGISQKHLAFEFLSDTSRWAVYDLDTSNGTLLNDAKVSPSVPFLLSDGDSIKIGEMTSISVRISRERPHIDVLPPLEQKEETTWARQRARRRGAPPARSVAEPPSDAVVEGSEAPARYGGRRRGRSKKAAVSARISMKDEILGAAVVEESTEVSKNAGRGRGRGRRPVTRASSAWFSKEEKPLGSVPVTNAEAVEAAEKADFRVEANNTGDGVKLSERGAVDVGQEKGEDGMDKMTLGEWFDRMEKFLPMMINETSEEIISSLREKAQRFDEFMAQSVNAS
ncbi:FHA domain-containing protein [Cocos nucifera]|uniref:FHA domain-containing protein n=1 Tax=Cocos nucifera TaxID=13894 RepID=A0A8K0N067_COCNU|nr:FHA domain-containing protein [Cocos nucifera]